MIALLQLFVAVMLLTTGGPSRAAEIAMTSFALPDGGPRNIAIMHGILMALQFYAKPRAQKPADELIPKPFCPRLSRLLMLFLTPRRLPRRD